MRSLLVRICNNVKAFQNHFAHATVWNSHLWCILGPNGGPSLPTSRKKAAPHSTHEVTANHFPDTDPTSRM